MVSAKLTLFWNDAGFYIREKIEVAFFTELQISIYYIIHYYSSFQNVNQINIQ